MKLIRRQFGPDRPAHTVDWEMLTGTPLQILLSFAFTGNTCIERKKNYILRNSLHRRDKVNKWSMLSLKLVCVSHLQR